MASQCHRVKADGGDRGAAGSFPAEITVSQTAWAHCTAAATAKIAAPARRRS